MTGKEIAANLRAHRNQWTRYYYFKNGNYCVIGLKLHEAGVKVEKWGESIQAVYLPSVLKELLGVTVPPDSVPVRDRFKSLGLSDDDLANLYSLQSLNDSARDVDELINKLENSDYATEDFPIEALAAAFKAK